MNAIIERVKRQRTARGLKLVFGIPGSDRPFVCYPRDTEQKADWIHQALERGWSLVMRDSLCES